MGNRLHAKDLISPIDAMNILEAEIEDIETCYRHRVNKILIVRK